MSDTIREAVEKAANEQAQTSVSEKAGESTKTEAAATSGNGEATSTDDTNAESTSTATNSETTSTGESLEVEASPEEITKALEILKTLQDPREVKSFVTQLAKDIGLEVAPGTKTEVEKVKDDTLSILKEFLGDENVYLADQLAKALDVILEKKIITPAKQKELEFQAQQVSNEVEKVLSDMTKKYDDFEKLQPEMNKLLKKFSPGQDVKMRDYVEEIYKMAKNSSEGKKTVVKTVEKKIEKMKTNAQEARSNVSSDVSDSSVTNAPQRMTAKEAVQKAWQELTGSKA